MDMMSGAGRGRIRPVALFATALRIERGDGIEGKDRLHAEATPAAMSAGIACDDRLNR